MYVSMTIIITRIVQYQVCVLYATCGNAILADLLWKQLKQTIDLSGYCLIMQIFEC